MKIGSELSQVLAEIIVAGGQPCLVGSPGVGKTAILNDTMVIVDQMLRDLKEGRPYQKAKMLYLHPAVDAPERYGGVPTAISDKRANLLPIGKLADLIDSDPSTLHIVFADDIGQSTTATQGALMQVVHDRKLGDYELPPNVQFVGATNRKGDKAGVSGMIEPLKSRFCPIIPVETDYKSWTQWALGKRLRPDIIAWINRQPHFLEQKEYSTSPEVVHSNARLVDKMSTVVNAIEGKVHDDVLSEIVLDCVGGEAGASYNAYRKLAAFLPNMDKIVADPDSVKLPDLKSTDGLGIMYLFVTHAAVLAARERNRLAPYFRYIERAVKDGSAEFAAMFYHMVIAVDPSLAADKSMVMHGVKYGRLY